MRESYGAMWIFGICLIFIIMMTAYLAISINYAKAFRVKSHLVSLIEEHEGYSSTLDEEIENYLDTQGYTARGNCTENLTSRTNDESWEYLACLDKDETGRCSACIYRTFPPSSKEGPTIRARYKVMTFFRFDVPVAKALLTFPVVGESRNLFNFANS